MAVSNKKIAQKFDLLAKLMELHEENSFKIKSYVNAYQVLRKIGGEISNMSIEELESIPGVGKAISQKIIEIVNTGELPLLEKYINNTPDGVVEMLSIRGFGPKKVKQIWKELEVESIGELLYACNENRLVSLKGFGFKTQEELKKKIEYFEGSKNKFLFGSVYEYAIELVEILRQKINITEIHLCGDILRQLPEVKGIEILLCNNVKVDQAFGDLGILKDLDKDIYKYHEFPVYTEFALKEELVTKLFRSTCSDEFLSSFGDINPNVKDEIEIFNDAKVLYLPPFRRENPSYLKNAEKLNQPIEISNIKGIIHNHSTYSDGIHTLQEMSRYVYDQGFEYFVISDHSKSAFYANGLTEEKVLQQWKEIDQLNYENKNFKIVKGIESDILSEGELDYSHEILEGFDCVIASIHSNLRMDKEKSMKRLVKAIENPFTKILGHPTGRLLLSREGYPIDHKLIIDACAANRVCIELNANPQRLDIDWKWIDYAMEKNVWISINPDAHSKENIHHIQYGIFAAQKSNLDINLCLNCLCYADFMQWLISK